MNRGDMVRIFLHCYVDDRDDPEKSLLDYVDAELWTQSELGITVHSETGWITFFPWAAIRFIELSSETERTYGNAPGLELVKR